MTDAFDPEQPELPESSDASIGVGMGGSCPNCRAPVDLGQEFCLECGSAIRFTGRQRRARGAAGDRPAAAAVPVAPGRGTGARSGFPWVQFTIVLAIIVAGIAFAVVSGDDKGGKSGGTTQPALPSITNQTTATTSATQTATLEDCDPSRPIGTQPAVNPDPGSTADTPSADVPGADTGQFNQDDVGTGDQFPSADGADTSGDTDDTSETGSDGSTTLTVDQDGAICPTDPIASPTDPTTDPTDPLDPTDPTGTGTTPTPTAPTSPSNPSNPGATTPATTTPSTTPTDDWPAGKDGYTVIVAGYKGDEARARELAADLKQNDFEGGVLDSSDYSSLCPGYWVTFSGYFTSKAQAEAHKRELSAESYQNTYTKDIKRTGGSATGCSS